MAGNWSDYEFDCVNLLAMKFEDERVDDRVKIISKGQHDAYQADAGVEIDGVDEFSMEFKKVQVPGDKCVMAPFTMTEANGLLELTDSAEQKVNDIEGMLDVACEIQCRSEEIIPKEGKTAYVREWQQYGEDEVVDFGMSATDLDLNFQMSLGTMVSDFYWKKKNVSFFMIGNTPFPFFNDWKHIYEYFDFYVQVRAKPSGGSKIKPDVLAELERIVQYDPWLSNDDWFVENGRLYISPAHEIGGIITTASSNYFAGWMSENVFNMTDPATGQPYKLNLSFRDGWNMLKPHPVNLTVMPYGIYNGNEPDQTEAWAELDNYIRAFTGESSTEER